MPLSSVTIIVPCCNEAQALPAFLDAVLEQALQHGACEILIADGASTDGSRELLERCAAQVLAWRTQKPLLRLVDNPRRLTSTGLNACLKEAQGEVIVRMDVHTTYAPDYVEQCLAVLEETGASNVGGPWIARGTTPLSCAIAAAFQSPWAMGGARSRDPSYEGPLESVYLGCWRRVVFDEVGGFDETLVRNQDDEHNFRLNQAGHTVWQSPRIHSWYHPRTSLSALWRQWQQYGYWKVAVSAKHGRPTSTRQLVPALLVGTLAAASALGLVWPPAHLLGLGVAAAYALFVLSVSVREARRKGWRLLRRLPAVFACYHLAYGCGFLLGLWDTLRRRTTPRSALENLTR